eukprot:scaffold2792_cov112-Isochrysis_galbana.AAC.8
MSYGWTSLSCSVQRLARVASTSSSRPLVFLLRLINVRLVACLKYRSTASSQQPGSALAHTTFFLPEYVQVKGGLFPGEPISATRTPRQPHECAAFVTSTASRFAPLGSGAHWERENGSWCGSTCRRSRGRRSRRFSS